MSVNTPDEHPHKGAMWSAGQCYAPHCWCNRAAPSSNVHRADPVDRIHDICIDAEGDKLTRIAAVLGFTDEIERLRACLLEMYQSDGESSRAFDEAQRLLWPDESGHEPEPLRPGELEQLRRIDQAARRFVEAFDAEAVQDFLREVCAEEWKELNEALFDGRSGQKASAPQTEQTQVESVMVKVSGKSFRCPCGCNVFHHPPEKPEAFECNACGEWYVGE